MYYVLGRTRLFDISILVKMYFGNRLHSFTDLRLRPIRLCITSRVKKWTKYMQQRWRKRKLKRIFCCSISPHRLVCEAAAEVVDIWLFWLNKAVQAMVGLSSNLSYIIGICMYVYMFYFYSSSCLALLNHLWLSLAGNHKRHRFKMTSRRSIIG